MTRTRVIALLIAAHVPLGAVLRDNRQLATLHALGTLVVALWFLIRDRTPLRLVYLTAYISTCDVLWRMTEARIFWESGKYAIAGLLGLAMLKWRYRVWLAPVLYIALLIPATAFSASVSSWREQVSFNLSGPIALGVAVLALSQLRLTHMEVTRLLPYALMPVVCVSMIAFSSLRGAGPIQFTGEANFVTSGGFGPNQVSALLGLGALICFIYLVLEWRRFSVLSLFLLAAGIGLVVQAILTFSRGGVLNLVIAGFGTVLYLLARGRGKLRIIVGVFVVGATLAHFWPQLNEYTGGQLESRYEDRAIGRRGELYQNDLSLWRQNPVFGVGPGNSAAHRAVEFGESATHTEYSRLLAEHGVLGLGSLALLVFMAFGALRKAPAPYGRTLAVAFMLWSLTEMSHSAMRLAAISFVFALPWAAVHSAGRKGQPLTSRRTEFDV